jgi:hypothetical protein
MYAALLTIIADPVLILAAVPFIKLVIQWIFRGLFKDLTADSLKLAVRDTRVEVKKAAENEAIRGAFVSYVKYGSGLQRFFETITFALLSAVAGYAAYKGTNAWIPRLWMVMIVVVALSLLVVALRLFREKINPAIETSTKRINQFALCFNGLIVALEGYAKFS